MSPWLTGHKVEKLLFSAFILFLCLIPLNVVRLFSTEFFRIFSYASKNSLQFLMFSCAAIYFPPFSCIFLNFLSYFSGDLLGCTLPNEGHCSDTKDAIYPSTQLCSEKACLISPIPFLSWNIIMGWNPEVRIFVLSTRGISSGWGWYMASRKICGKQ